MTTIELQNSITDGFYAEKLDADITVLIRIPDSHGYQVDVLLKRISFAPDHTLLLET